MASLTYKGRYTGMACPASTDQAGASRSGRPRALTGRGVLPPASATDRRLWMCASRYRRHRMRAPNGYSADISGRAERRVASGQGPTAGRTVNGR